MSGAPSPGTAWVVPATDDGHDRSADRLLIRILVGVGVGLLWLTGLVVLFLNTFGDCFGPVAICDAAWVQATQRGQAMLAIMVILTVLGSFAFIKAGPRTLGLLLLATLLVGGAAFIGAEAEPYSIEYLPGGLEFIAPALVCFAIAAILGLVSGRRSTT